MKVSFLKFTMLVLLAFVFCLASQTSVNAQRPEEIQPDGGPGDGGGSVSGGGGGGSTTTSSLPPTPCTPAGAPFVVGCPNGALYFEELYRGASGTYLYSADQNEIQNAVNTLGYTKTSRAAGIILPYNASYTVPLYRFSGNWRFLYTIDYNEGVMAAQYGYTHFDGIAGYVALGGSAPIYRYELSNFRGKFYGTSGGSQVVYENGGTGFLDGLVWYSVPLQ